LKITLQNISPKKWISGLFVSALFVSFSAQAATFLEVESNDTLATAQVLVHDSSITLTGYREFNPGNLWADYFRFSAMEGSDIVFKVSGDRDQPDPGEPEYGSMTIGLLSNTGLALRLGFPAVSTPYDSLISYKIDRTGDYFAAVGAYGSVERKYVMSITGLTPVSPVPEPGEWAMMLCGLGVVGAIARQRRARA
jgi:hypothetical protein